MKLNNETCRREALIHMSTEQLDEILQQEVQKDLPDEEIVLTITAIIQDRESAQPVRVDDETLGAWEDFRKSCADDQAKMTVKKHSWGLRAAIIALVVGVLVMTVPQAAGAESIFEVIARWTERVFTFFGSVDEPVYVFETDHPGLQEIYDAVTEAGITQPVVPTWVPEGCELTELKVEEWPSKTKIQAVLKSEETKIGLTYMRYGKNTIYKYHKDVTPVATVELEGIFHSIIENDGTYTATWQTDRIECSISADCQENTILSILESIYLTEDT